MSNPTTATFWAKASKLAKNLFIAILNVIFGLCIFIAAFWFAETIDDIERIAIGAGFAGFGMILLGLWGAIEIDESKIEPFATSTPLRHEA